MCHSCASGKRPPTPSATHNRRPLDGKSWRESWTFTVTVLNVANSRYLLGRDSAFAGTYYNDPRQPIGQIRYRFHL
jgi:hypothetical protein